MINRLEPGDRQLSASSWNEMRDRINNITPNQDTVLTGNKNPFLVTIKNVTGSALDSLSIVTLADATYTRTDTTFANKAVEYGTEMNAVAPASEFDNIAVIQGACPENGFIKAIADGCTPAFVYKGSNTNYQYAKPVAGQTGYLQGTEEPTNIKVLWIASGTGKKEAYVCIDAIGTPEQEYFIINWGNDGTQTPVNDYSVYTKGSLHYIEYDVAYGFWKPIAANEGTPLTSPLARPMGTKLVVCQVDAPNSAKEFHIPYYTPESNMGVPPKITSYIPGNTYITGHYIGAGDRCGVLLGEHEFTDGSFDYLVTGVDGSAGAVRQGTGLTFVYQPNFVKGVDVTGTTGGGNDVYADVYGESWIVIFANTGMSTMNYPDIYPYDHIMVLVDFDNQKCIALDYSTDYQVGTEMPFWYAPGRGWDVITTPQGFLDLGMTLYKKVKTDAIL